VPAGKAPIRGAIGFQKRVPETVSARSLLDYKSRNHRCLSEEELEEHSCKIREALGSYLGFSESTPLLTGTQRRRAIREVRSVAQSLLRAIRSDDRVSGWRERLLTSLRSKDVNTRKLINDWLVRRWEFRRNRGYDRSLQGLERQLVKSAWPNVSPGDRRRLEAWLGVLAQIPDPELPKGTGRAPLLEELLRELAPIWEAITGLSALSRQTWLVDSKQDTKEHRRLRLHGWLSNMLRLAGSDVEVSEGAVLDALRKLRGKNPVPLTAAK